ncbi:hypothetical protein DLD77_01235 [Chitinophaga alhagiae]|uniref:Copper-binding protein MbnP-like domain-containing protein n=1 Tax=Chitinophaga alhagiae TaxID=2203219 RepID=A0ABN5LPL9_9BACT|nr:MbnP family protein [Chitinophaga alhagiae]AWO00425.1 hypothetical protein DLD77_01235 [Chitinophaga alhagiae]
MKPKALLYIFFMLLMACKKEKQEQGTLQLTFTNVVNGAALTLNTASYTNAAGEAFTVSAFRYYISNITLVRMDNSEVKLADTYFLVDESKPASRTLQVMAPRGEYRAFSFLLGVDSVRNVSGAQTGALDPVNGMFWSWNSGYIMAKMEGTSPASAAAGQALTFHIGGFRGEYNAVRRISLVSPISLTVAADRKPDVTIKADLYTWFSLPNQVQFAQTATIHVPGEDAWKISENYSNMFRITSVTDL